MPTLSPVAPDPAQLFDVLQIADSAFPNGSYAHSLGLEWLATQGPLDIAALVRTRLRDALVRVELPLVREAHAAAFSPAALLALDRLADVLLPVAELRQASRSMGRSFLRVARLVQPGALPLPLTLEHQPVVYGAVAAQGGLERPVTLHSYVFQALRQQLSAAQRLNLLGPFQMQQLLHALKPEALAAVQDAQEVPLEQAGSCAPWLDLASMRHQAQPSRLFLS